VQEFARATSRILTEMLEIGWAFRHLDRDARDELRRDLAQLGSMEWPNAEAGD
jgi:hypothetical protein